jgi:hypothetical protein
MPDEQGPPPGDVHVLTDLPGWDPALGDPGRSWHPHPGSPEWASDGTLRDLTPAEVYEHTNKPEASEEPDGLAALIAAHPAAMSADTLAAEDSAETPDGVV